MYIRYIKVANTIKSLSSDFHLAKNLDCSFSVLHPKLILMFDSLCCFVIENAV